MKKIIIFTAMMLLFSTVALAQKMTVEQTLTKIEKDIAAGLVKGDTTVFEKHFAANSILVDPGGMMMTREESIKLFKSGDLKFESLTVEDVKVIRHGNTAIVTYISADKGTFKGQPIGGKSRWTDTFLLMKGTWMIVAAQGTPIMEMPPAQEKK